VIPLVAVVSLNKQNSRTFRLWVPIALSWLLLVPLVVLFSPLILIACLLCQVNPFRMFSVGWQILSALKDTKVELGRRTAAVSVCIL
jgi:hypothetical protein